MEFPERAVTPVERRHDFVHQCVVGSVFAVPLGCGLLDQQAGQVECLLLAVGIFRVEQEETDMMHFSQPDNELRRVVLDVTVSSPS